MAETRSNLDYSIPEQVDRLRASPRLFDNDLLDKLSRVHWSTPLFVYAPVVALLAWVSVRSLGPAAALAAAAGGYLIWTLTEYFGHRFPFHYKHPSTFGRRIHFLVHGVHHDHPNDPLRLVMPVLLSGPIMLIALGVVTLLFGLPLGYAVLTGFMIGYLAYDMVHYYTHHATPTTKLGQTLRRLHLMHHFRDPTRGFGVAAPWWDYVFGTAHQKQRRREAAE
ncbi:sterol desaturase family protein [Methylocella sp.]|uniref:sterol desaturase family protein n=1 Tax=Methylocella sp. TaxID=1978226 RepID=UPI00378511D4